MPIARRIRNAVVLLVSAAPALFSQTDEIQVYDASIAPKGVFNLMVHTNFTPAGRKATDFPGAIVANHSVNGASEWAYGVTRWFEQGLYLPVYSVWSDGHGGTINGFKLRELFVRPDADNHTFVYGVNFEFSVNSKHWDPRRISSEIRPIVGVHLSRWDLIFNPILDTEYSGGPGNLDFAPALRVGYNVNRTWTLAIEEYADLGPLRHFRTLHDQSHEVWAVTEYKGKIVNVETGFGIGVTAGSDRFTLKLMVSRDLNPRRTN